MQKLRGRLVIAFLPFFCSAAAGMFSGPTFAPVDRLIQNATAHTREHPDDAQGYYTLGRIHYLAFVTRAAEIMTPDNPPPPEPDAEWLVQSHPSSARRNESVRRAMERFGYASLADVKPEARTEFFNTVSDIHKKLTHEGWQPPQIPLEKAVAHVDAAAENFMIALDKDNDNALYHLGLACLYEQYVNFLEQNDVDLVPASIRQVILDTARQGYYTAYSLSIKQDLKNKYLPLRGLGSLVGYEAGRGYVRLTEAIHLTAGDDGKKLAAVRKDIKTLEGLKMNAITPIVFSRSPHKSLSDLLDKDTNVLFDLDGDGSAEQWPWVKPDTGILVWDPAGRGRITSGRQLFGSVTWWLFFADGYRALDALDDNRDGRLTGAELDGIAVWIDKNSNGVSDAGEVRDARGAGIRAIATQPSCMVEGIPARKGGIAFTDGTASTTYDWTTEPLDR